MEYPIVFQTKGNKEH